MSTATEPVKTTNQQTSCSAGNTDLITRFNKCNNNKTDVSSKIFHHNRVNSYVFTVNWLPDLMGYSERNLSCVKGLSTASTTVIIILHSSWWIFFSLFEPLLRFLPSVVTSGCIHWQSGIKVPDWFILVLFKRKKTMGFTSMCFMHWWSGTKVLCCLDISPLPGPVDKRQVLFFFIFDVYDSIIWDAVAWLFEPFFRPLFWRLLIHNVIFLWSHRVYFEYFWSHNKDMLGRFVKTCRYQWAILYVVLLEE